MNPSTKFLLTRSKPLAYLVVPLILAVCTIIFFYPVFFFHLYPYPGDLLVSYFFPWFSGGWSGYDSWTTHKAFLSSDSIRQMIPWRYLAIHLLKQHQIPLWNPHNFTGTPLLANHQSAVFYPLNLIFFILPFLQAWTFYILIQPFFIAYGFYLFLRHFRISPAVSLMVSISYTGSSYFINWMESGIIGHTIMWLPLLLLGIEKFISHRSWRWISLITLSTLFSFLAGHPQAFINIFLTANLYWFFRACASRDFKYHLLVQLLSNLLIILFSSIQLLPTLELHRNSPLTTGFDYQIFITKPTPWKNLITFIAPDFWGHPATANFSSDIYGDGTPFYGVVVFFFTFVGLSQWRRWPVNFFICLSIIYTLYVFPGPVFHLVKFLHLPVFSETLAARSSFILIFCMAFISAFGLEHASTSSNRKVILSLLSGYTILFPLLLICVYFSAFHPNSFLSPISSQIAFRNLIIPTGLVVFTFINFLIFLSWRYHPKIFIYLLIITSIFHSTYQIKKTLPFSPAQFFFPPHPLITQLKNTNQPLRFAGHGSAQIDKNLATFFQLYSTEGYDSLRINRYAQFFETHRQGDLPTFYSKSDSQLIDSENRLKRRLLNLLGVHFYLDKRDVETSMWHPEPQNFPNDQVELIWQQGATKIYRRPTALPRAFLVNNYFIETTPQALIDRLYDPADSMRSAVIFEHSLPVTFNPDPDAQGTVTFDSYQPNRIHLSVQSTGNTFLFLSDAYFPGWTAYLNQKRVPIYRANYAFRALPIPGGIHSVSFKYQPSSFIWGLTISVFSLGFAVISLYLAARVQRIDL